MLLVEKRINYVETSTRLESLEKKIVATLIKIGERKKKPVQSYSCFRWRGLVTANNIKKKQNIPIRGPVLYLYDDEDVLALGLFTVMDLQDHDENSEHIKKEFFFCYLAKW